MPDQSLRDRNRSQRRNRILDELIVLLEDRDAAEIPADEIAERASLSRATVFNYFPSKREMLLAVAEREIERLEETAKRLAAAGVAPLDIINETMFELVTESFSACSAAWQVFRTLLADPSDEESPVWTLMRRIAELVEDARDTGSVRSDIDAHACARAILGTYLCELFVVTAERGPRAEVRREDFDRSVAVLVERWLA